MYALELSSLIWEKNFGSRDQPWNFSYAQTSHTKISVRLVLRTRAVFQGSSNFSIENLLGLLLFFPLSRTINEGNSRYQLFHLCTYRVYRDNWSDVINGQFSFRRGAEASHESSLVENWRKLWGKFLSTNVLLNTYKI